MPQKEEKDLYTLLLYYFQKSVILVLVPNPPSAVSNDPVTMLPRAFVQRLWTQDRAANPTLSQSEPQHGVNQQKLTLGQIW